MTEGEVISYLRALLEMRADVHVETSSNAREIAIFVRGTGGNARTAMIRTPGSRWFSTEIEDAFDISFVDEDAEDFEIESYLRTCAQIASAYVLQGAREQRRGFFRSRSLVVDVEGTPVHVQKMIGRWVRRRPRSPRCSRTRILPNDVSPPALVD